jgi:hypothetical protein
MLRAMAKDGKTNRPLLMLGLSHANLAKLEQGQPIHVDGTEMGIDIDVLLWAGETDESLGMQLEQHHLVPPGTVPHRLKSDDRIILFRKDEPT